MRFYSIGYQELLDTPIRGFWSLNKQISRIRSDEALASMNLYLLGNMGSDKMYAEIKQSYIDATGNFVKMASEEKESQKDGLTELMELHEKIYGKR